MQDQLSASPRALSKKQYLLVSNLIDHWQQTETVDQETARNLKESLIAVSFEWKRLARYSFIIAICCFVIASGAVLADEVFLDLLARLFNAPLVVKSLFFAVVSAALFRYGFVRRDRYPQKT